MNFSKKLLPVLIALSCAPMAYAQYTSFTVFGDSLSDAGTFGARFTTNPGNVWSQNVSTALGFAGNPAQSNLGGVSGFTATGGNIWAQGGARVAATPGYGMTMAQPVSTQLAGYLASQGGTASGNGLYAVWAGANDIFYQMTAYQGGSISAAALQGNVGSAAQALAAQVAQLQGSGARNIVVFNLPDLGKTPAAVAGGATAQAGFSGLATLYNATLSSTLSALGAKVLVLDANGLFNEIIASPAAYGLTVGNTGVACLTASSLTCSPATLVAPNAAQTYLFADGVHPTTAGHKIISDYFMSVMNAPAFAGYAADHLAQAGELQWSTSDSRQQRFLNGTLPEGKGDFYGQLLGGTVSSDGNAGASVSTNGLSPSLSIGFDRNLGGGALIGAAVSFVSDHFGINGGQHGDASGQGVGVNLYGSQRFGKAYVNVSGMLTSSSYTLDRQFAIGVAQRTESGNASGSVKGLRLEGGYDLAQGDLRHGPFLGLSYRHISFDAYSEDSGSATAMRFGAQSLDQIRPAVGYQASWQANNTLRLSGRASYEKEMNNGQRDLTFGLVNTAGDLTATVGNSNKPDFLRLALQADLALSAQDSVSIVAGGYSGSGTKQGVISVNYAMRF